MINVLICDDDLKFCDFITPLVIDSLIAKSIDYTLSVLTSTKDIQDSDYFDLCLLDIDMPFNGIDLACCLRKRNKDVLVVFISAKINLILNSFEAHPYDFIPKTTNTSNLIKKIDQITSKFKPCYYHFSYKGIEKNINLQDIYLIEKFNNDLFIKTKDYSYRQRKKLSTILEELNILSECFVQVSKSIIVNVKKIEDFRSNSLVLVNNITITSTKTYCANAKKKYLQSL